MKDLLSRKSPMRLLVVDDEARHRELLREVFPEEEYRLTEAEHGQEALERLREASFDVVLLDNNMPVMNGVETCRRIREQAIHKFLPVIMVTAMNTPLEVARVLRAGASDFVGKPYSPLELESRVRSAAMRKRAVDQLENAETILFTLGLMVEARDSATGDHCLRLGILGRRFGHFLGLDEEEIDALRRGGFLHDLGKLAIPDAILLKKGGLTPEEWEVMRKHPAIGASLCEPLYSMREVLPIIRHHHERFDGGGYPDGLAGGAIPPLARVFQILDVFDALAHARSYKSALGLDQCLEILSRDAEAGKMDPELVAAFVAFANRELRNAPEGGAVHEEAVLDHFGRIVGRGLLAGTRFG